MQENFRSVPSLSGAESEPAYCKKRNVKTPTLEKRKGAAPKFVLALRGCAARLGAASPVLALTLAFVPSPYGLG